MLENVYVFENVYIFQPYYHIFFGIHLSILLGSSSTSPLLASCSIQRSWPELHVQARLLLIVPGIDTYDHDDHDHDHHDNHDDNEYDDDDYHDERQT